MYTLLVASVIQGYHEYKGLKDLVNFASSSGDEKIDIFIPQVFTHAWAKFLSRSQELEINLVG